MGVTPAIMPNIRYKDAPAAIEFLCDGFGFERYAVYADDEDPSIIHHAELVYGGQMLMIATAMASEWTDLAAMKTVAEAGGNTQTIYMVVEDVAGHCERARAAGATIIMEPEAKDYGGSTYGALDPEGNAWSFGDFDPFADASG